MSLRERFLISVFVSIVFLFILYYSVVDLNVVYEYYSENIRASLFTGFLTVGSFLLSLKAFIIVKLKENIYDSKSYKDKFKERRKLNNNLTLYGPLKRLGYLIFLSITSAIIASVSQLSIGLIQHWVATFFCIFLSVFSACMLVSTLFLIKSILDNWLNYLEDENNNNMNNY